MSPLYINNTFQNDFYLPCYGKLGSYNLGRIGLLRAKDLSIKPQTDSYTKAMLNSRDRNRDHLVIGLFHLDTLKVRINVVSFFVNDHPV